MSLPHPSKIKVVMLIGQLEFGGTERQLYLLLRHLDLGLFEPIVIVLNSSQTATYNHAVEALGIKVFVLPNTCRGIFRRSTYLYRLFRQFSPQIVHSWTVHDNAYAGLVGYLARVPLRLGSVRGMLSAKEFHDLPIVYKILSLQSTPYLVVNSQSIAAELVASGVSEGRIIVLPNCVDIVRTEDENLPLVSQEDVRIVKGQQLIGSIGNLRSVKNHLMFVDGLAKIVPDYPDFAGIIVGQATPNEADYAARIRSRIAEHGMEGQIVLAGFRSDVSALMRRFNVFCITSDYEGTPNVILEAMAAARPVVATRVGGIPDLVQDGVTGFLVNPGDVEGFAAAVKKLLNDPVLAERMGRAGREIIEEYGCEKSVQYLGRFYLQSLEEMGVKKILRFWIPRSIQRLGIVLTMSQFRKRG